MVSIAHPRIMHLCINKRRISFHPTSSEHEVFRKAVARSAWPKHKVFLEFSESRFVEINNEVELMFASKLVSESLYSELKDWMTDFRQREVKIEAHMQEPDSDVDLQMHSDDDLTMDDWYSMGYRHETET